MKKILIIGAGQLGSRHLQGVLKVEENLNVYVVDPSLESLQTAKIRGEEITHSHTIKFLKDWELIPLDLDVVIVATGANIRAKIVEELLNTYKVKNLILEKVLFQDVESYKLISSLINKTNTPTWVNHPRRMFDFYKKIKEIYKKSKDSNMLMQVVGGNWGLGCNALHFIDLFCFLTDSEISSLNTELIDSEVYKSKREGYSEFTGSLLGRTKKGDSFTITSFDDAPSDINVNLFTNSNRWLINEGKEKKVISLSKEKEFKEEIENINIGFQSTLTTEVLIDLLKNNECELSPFSEACGTHLSFIESIINEYEKITKKKIKNCPIT